MLNHYTIPYKNMFTCNTYGNNKYLIRINVIWHTQLGDAQYEMAKPHQTVACITTVYSQSTSATTLFANCLF